LNGLPHTVVGVVPGHFRFPDQQGSVWVPASFTPAELASHGAHWYVVARLKPLAVPGNAWFGSAGELVGAAYLKQGRPELAGPLFAQIAKDKTVPETLRARARQLAGVLGVDAIEDVGQALAQSPVAGAPAAPAQ